MLFDQLHTYDYCPFNITSLARLVRPLNPPIAKTSRSQGTITWWQHSGLAATRGCFLTILWFGRVAGTKVIGFSQKNFPGDSTPLPQSARRCRKWPFLDRPFDDPTTTTFLQQLKLLDASTDLLETWTGYRGGSPWVNLKAYPPCWICQYNLTVPRGRIRLWEQPVRVWVVNMGNILLGRDTARPHNV